MPQRKTIWGFFLENIARKHWGVLDQTYSDILSSLAECVVASDFRPFHSLLGEINSASHLSFISELADDNSDYAHIDYLRKHFFVESFALIGDFIGLLNAQRTLINKGSQHIAAHYGLYRRLLPDLIATGREVYYCCLSRSWLIRTKRKGLKELVLEQFSAAAEEGSRGNGRSFFEEFASRHERAIRTSLEESGFASLHLQYLLKRDKDLLLQIAESVPSAFKRHVQQEDWNWLASIFPSEQEVTATLEAAIRQMELRLPLGQLFLEFLPNYSLFYEVWQQPNMRKRTKSGPTGLYPECCKSVVYLPFGMAGIENWPPAGGIYMVALIHAATRWLEEFSAPWK